MVDLTEYFQEQSGYVVQYLVVTLGKLWYAYFYSEIRLTSFPGAQQNQRGAPGIHC